MNKTRISAGEVRDQFDYDPETGELLRKRLRARNMRPETGSATKAGIIVGVNGGHEFAHRLVWLWVHGDWPSKQIEHINGDKTDNRIANLRLRNPSAKMPLTLDRLKGLLRYERETGKFFWKKTSRATREGEEAGHVREHHGYRAITIDGTSYYAHRLVWLWESNEWPKHNVDHQNGNRDDNRIENLKDLTFSQNSHNTSKLGPNNTTGFRGVTRYRDKFIAQIMVAGVAEAISMHDNPEDAAKAYAKRYEEIFGGPPPNCSEKVYPRKSRSKKD